MRAKVVFPDGRTKEREIHAINTTFPHIISKEQRVPVVRSGEAAYEIRRDFHWLYIGKKKQQIDA